MADYKNAGKKAEKTNQRRRKESKVEIINSREKMSAFLFDHVSPLDGLLLDGNDEDRHAVLYRWLEQLYASESAAGCPLIVTGPAKLDKVMERLASNIDCGIIPQCRPFYWIGADAVPYEFFLGLDVSQMQEVLSVYAGSNRFELSDWLIFVSVCDLLEENGYEMTLSNLERMYDLSRNELAGMLSSAGMESAAVSCSKDDREYSRMQQVLRSMANKFGPLMGRKEYGISIVEKVERARAEETPMPIFYIPMTPRYSKDLLEYLSAELKQISSYTDPILVMEDTGISEDTCFWDYIRTPSNVHLTLSARSCLSLFGGRDAEGLFETLDGIYGFRMLLLKSTNDIEKLTKNRSVEYDFTRVTRSSGTDREFLRPLPRGSHEGIQETTEKRRNLRREDVAALPEHRGCIVVFDHSISIYRQMMFD